MKFNLPFEMSDTCKVMTVECPHGGIRQFAAGLRPQLIADEYSFAVVLGPSDESGTMDTWIVTPEGGLIPCGQGSDSLHAIAEFERERQKAHRIPVVAVGHETCIETTHDAYDQAAKLLCTAQAARMFTGMSGNLSVRVSARGDMLVSPTGVDKRKLRSAQMIHAEYEYVTPSLHYYGGSRPSVDAPLQLHLYASFPKLEAFLHVHDDAGLFRGVDAFTTFPYECGTLEEAREVEHHIRSNGLDEQRNFNMKLAHHGYLLGFSKGGVEEFASSWRRAHEALVDRALRAGMSADEARRLYVQPVFSGSRVIGAVGTSVDGFEILEITDLELDRSEVRAELRKDHDD